MSLVRGRFGDLFQMAEDLGPYDNWPLLPAGVDPQLHASRNDRPQPFHLVHEHDALLVHFSGTGRVEFTEGPVRYHELIAGDHVYLPAGLPYRLMPSAVCLQITMKAAAPGLEGVIWHCESCGAQLSRVEFDADTEVPQFAYDRLCREFNDDVEHRTCQNCGTVHAGVDVGGFRWLKVGQHLESSAAADGT